MEMTTNDAKIQGNSWKEKCANEYVNYLYALHAEDARAVYNKTSMNARGIANI
jgi:hypothetical protein